MVWVGGRSYSSPVCVKNAPASTCGLSHVAFVQISAINNLERLRKMGDFRRENAELCDSQCAFSYIFYEFLRIFMGKVLVKENLDI